MLNHIRHLVSLSISGTIVLGFALTTSAQTIAPQSKPNCEAPVCTSDGSDLPEPTVATAITPETAYATDETAIGVEPQAFVIPAGDR